MVQLLVCKITSLCVHAAASYFGTTTRDTPGTHAAVSVADTLQLFVP